MTEPAEETAETPVEVAEHEEAPAVSEPEPSGEPSGKPSGEPSGNDPTPVEPLPPKAPEKAECSLCGKSMNKKSLSAHMRVRCKQRPEAPKVTAVPVAPVEKAEAPPSPPPSPRRGQRQPSKTKEPDDEDYDEKVEEAEAYGGPYRGQPHQRPLTRVDKMRLLAQSGLP